MKKMPSFALAAVFAAGIVLGFSTGALTAEKHPHMRAAIRLLNQVQQQLERAGHDYDGHRATALRLAKEAEAHVKAGIAWDDARDSKKPGPKQ